MNFRLVAVKPVPTTLNEPVIHDDERHIWYTERIGILVKGKMTVGLWWLQTDLADERVLDILKQVFGTSDVALL